MQHIICKNLAPPVGPYSHAVIIDNLIFCSGQIPLTKDGNLISDDVEEQCLQVLKNIQELLLSCNSSIDKVIKSTVFLTNLEDFKKINTIYEKFFQKTKPARSCVEVSKLPCNSLIEIEVIAQK